MSDYQNIELVIPTGGGYNVSEFLKHREVVDVTVIGFFLLQMAKPGARALRSEFKVGKPERLLYDINSEKDALILRAPAVDIKLKKFKVGNDEEVFFADKMDVEIPAAAAISYDDYKEFTFSGSFDPKTYRFDIPGKQEFDAVVVKFSVKDKNKVSVDPLACKNKILVPVYFNSKDDKSKKINQIDLMTLLICNGYDVKNNKIAFWPDTRIVGFLADKIKPCDIPFRYFDTNSHEIEDNDYLDPYESRNTLIPITDGYYEERNADSILFEKHGRCKFDYRVGKDYHTQDLVYSLGCDIKRHKDRVILSAEMIAREELNATGILLQIVFFGDPEITKKTTKLNLSDNNPITATYNKDDVPQCVLPHMGLELETGKTSFHHTSNADKMADLNNKVVIWGEGEINNIAKDIGLKPGHKIEGDIAITGIFMWQDCNKGDIIYFPELQKMEVVDYQGNSNFVYSKLNLPCWLGYSDRSSYIRSFQRDFKFLRVINGRDDIFETNISLELNTLTGVIQFSSSPKVSGLLLDISGIRIESETEDDSSKDSDKEENIANLTSPDNKVDEDNKSFTIIKEEATMDTKTAMLMMMAMGNNNSEGSNNNMNMMLPMMLMGDDDDDGEGNNFKDLALIMMMSQNQNSNEGGCGMNMLLPMMLMDKSNGKKDMLLMMTMLQKQANLERTVQLLNKQNTEG